MRSILLSILAAVSVVGALSCGAAGAGSCTVTSGSYCINYTGSGFTASAVQTACPASVGTYSSGTCPTSSAGVCTFGAGTTGEYKWTFASADAGAGVSVQSECTTAGGTFSAN